MTATTPRKRRAAATAAAETAAPAQPLADRILAAVADAHSRKPANADDVLAVIGGDAADFWRALEQLKCECRINAATIKTKLDAVPWMAIWPTGTPVAHRTWKDLNAAGAFTTLPAACMPKRTPTTPDLDRDPRPDLRKITREAEGKIVPVSADQRRDRIAQLAAGRTLANGIKFADVAADLGISVEGVRHLTKRMGEGARVAFGHLAGESAHRIYDPAAEQPADIFPIREGDMATSAASLTPEAVHAAFTHPEFEQFIKQAEAPSAEPIGEPEPDLRPDQVVEPADQAIAEPNAPPCAKSCTDACADFPGWSSIAADLSAIADALGEMEPEDATPAPPPQAKPARVSFALWDDGGLSIYDGDDLLQLPPADTARLARLLGVPGSPLHTQEQRA